MNRRKWRLDPINEKDEVMYYIVGILILLLMVAPVWVANGLPTPSKYIANIAFLFSGR